MPPTASRVLGGLLAAAVGVVAIGAVGWLLDGSGATGADGAVASGESVALSRDEGRDGAGLLGRFTAVPLFCDSAGAGCSRVTSRVHVRATFVGLRGP